MLTFNAYKTEKTFESLDEARRLQEEISNTRTAHLKYRMVDGQATDIRLIVYAN